MYGQGQRGGRQSVRPRDRLRLEILCFYRLSRLFGDRPRQHEKGNWRRERDSNPRRAFDPYTLSRGAPSTTRPSLRERVPAAPVRGAIILKGWGQGKEPLPGREIFSWRAWFLPLVGLQPPRA